jgi:hypothetical protein
LFYDLIDSNLFFDSEPFGVIYFKMLRPEFVKSYLKPLSPDAFSNFGRLDSEIHNQEVNEATQELHQRIINISKSDLKINESTHPTSLLEILHSKGKIIIILKKLIELI